MEQILGVPMFQNHTSGMEAPDEGSSCLMSALPLEFSFSFSVQVFCLDNTEEEGLSLQAELP